MSHVAFEGEPHGFIHQPSGIGALDPRENASIDDWRTLRLGIAVAQFNAAVTEQLFAGAVDAALKLGLPRDQLVCVQVAGAVELPLAVRQLLAADAGACAAAVALGCVVRGETAHFDYVCRAATDGCMRVSLDTGLPVGFGVLTCETAEQARERSQLGGGRNAGADAVRAACGMAILAQQLKRAASDGTLLQAGNR